MTSGDGLSLIGSQFIATSPAGRVCATEGCSHVLSIYNHGRHCHVHWRDGEDDPERMNYHGHTLAHCPVCDTVKTLREFRPEFHMCRGCARQHAPVKTCRRCGETKNRAEFPEHSARCRPCVAAAWRERNADKGYNARAYAKKRGRA